MRKIFNVRADALAAAQKQRRKQFMEAGGYAILLFWAFFFRSDDVARDLAKKFDSDVSSVQGFLLFLIIGFLFMGVMSVILGALANKKLQRLSCSYVTLDDNGVAGMSYATVDSDGVQFFAEYADIQNVFCRREELNLVIQTKHLTFNCLEITEAKRVAELIQENMTRSEQSNQKTEEPPKQSALPDNETDKDAAHFKNVRSEFVICPFCNTMQSSKLSSCSECGVAFVFE